VRAERLSSSSDIDLAPGPSWAGRKIQNLSKESLKANRAPSKTFHEYVLGIGTKSVTEHPSPEQTPVAVPRQPVKQEVLGSLDRLGDIKKDLKRLVDSVGGQAGWFERDRTKRLQVPDRDKEVAGLKALNRGAFGLGVGAGPGDARVSIAERLKESIRSGQSITSTMRMSEVLKTADDAVDARLSKVRDKAAATKPKPDKKPSGPIVWPIYQDAPQADARMVHPNEESSSLSESDAQEQMARGDIWGITSFFNPEGYQNKIDNFRLFRKRTTKQQGLPLIVVELTFGKSEFNLREDRDAEILIQRRTDPNNVLWQKERMLNIALKHLPSNCTKVVWLDADTFFTNTNWVRETSERLDRFHVVQPFAWLVRLPPETRWINPADIDVSLKWEEGGLVPFRQIYFSAGFMTGCRGLHQMVYHVINDENDHELGHVGIAWAAQRWILEKHKFYDRFVVGGADNMMFQAMVGHFRGTMRLHLGPPMRRNVAEWANAFYRDVRGNVSYTDGVALTLWHGDRKHRGYSMRYNLLREANFDPVGDLVVEEDSGVWKWASDKPKLHKDVQDYFSSRKEETMSWREYVDDAYHVPAVSKEGLTKEELERDQKFHARELRISKHFRQFWQDYRSGRTYGYEHKPGHDTVTGMVDVDI